MLLERSTWCEIEDYLRTSKLIVVPVGSIEQHGPTGLLGTDALCPYVIAVQAQRGENFLVAPTFNVGVAQHHLLFSGTLSLRPSTFISAFGDWVRSLALHGFERIYFLNGHGGNIASIEAAISEVHSDASYRGKGGKIRMRLRNWWDLEGVQELVASLFPAGEGEHATASEIAITQWAYPDEVRHVELSPATAPTGSMHDAVNFRRQFPDGRVGSNPLQATPEAGRAIVTEAARALVRDVEMGWE